MLDNHHALDSIQTLEIRIYTNKRHVAQSSIHDYVDVFTCQYNA